MIVKGQLSDSFWKNLVLDRRLYEIAKTESGKAPTFRSIRPILFELKRKCKSVKQVINSKDFNCKEGFKDKPELLPPFILVD